MGDFDNTKHEHHTMDTLQVTANRRLARTGYAGDTLSTEWVSGVSRASWVLAG